jgi:hypothetical protein
MRKYIAPALFFLFSATAPGQPAPAGWKVVKDTRGACRIAVPENWSVSENAGSAVFQDPTTGIAVVTSQPGQAFQPMSDSLIRLLNIAKNKLFENTAKRIFYQDKTARGSEDSSSFSAMVPGKSGTCSSRVLFISLVSEETAKKIALTVAPVRD